MIVENSVQNEGCFGVPLLWSGQTVSGREALTNWRWLCEKLAEDDESLSPGKWRKKLVMCSLEKRRLRDNMYVLSCLKGMSCGRGISTNMPCSKE